MLDSAVSALPLMASNAAKYVTKQPELQPQIAAWTALYQSLSAEREEFEVLFNKWRQESRGSHRPTMRGDVLTNVLGSQGGTVPFFKVVN